MSSGRANQDDNDGNKRRSRRVSDIDDETPCIQRRDGPPPAKKTRISVRTGIQYCTDIKGLEDNHHCDGCQRVRNSSRSSKKP